MKNSSLASLAPILLLSFSLCFISSPLGRTGGAFAQFQFQRTIGGTDEDGAYSIIRTTDGGYAAAGYTVSFGAGNTDVYIVKLNASGTLHWSKTIGGTNWDYGYSIIQTTDGGYAVAGNTTSFGAGNGDMYIVKLDATGTLQWSKTIGGAFADVAYSIIRTTDGGYAVAGRTNSFGAGGDMYIVKLDAGGTLQWNKAIGGTNDDGALSIIQTTDGGYAAAGVTYSFGAGNYSNFYIVKLDGSGVLQWSKTIGDTNTDEAYSIIQTTDGGYAVAGFTSSFGAGQSDFYIVKLNGSGTLQWSKTIGGTNYDDAFSIIQTTDGGYAAAGYTLSFGAGGDMYIVKLDAGGNTCGNSTSPTSTVMTPTPTVTTPTSTVTTPTPTVTTPAPTVSSGGTVTTLCFIGIQPISNEVPSRFELYQNYPNPFNPVTKIKFDIPANFEHRTSNIELIIYDALGREITEIVNQELRPGTYSVDWDAANFPSGIYFYELQSGDFTQTRRMVLIK